MAVTSFDYTVSYNMMHQEPEPEIARDAIYLLYKLLASYNNYVKYVCTLDSLCMH